MYPQNTTHKVSLQVSLNTPKSKVWDALYHRFGEVHKFNPLIECSHEISASSKSANGVDCERQCDLNSKGSKKLLERIVKMEESSDGKMSFFEVEIYDGSLPGMKNMYGRWTVTEVSATQTQAELELFYSTKIRFLAPLMKLPMQANLKKVGFALKTYLEKGLEVGKHDFTEMKMRYA